jgi:hypothetical protein
MEVQKAKMLSEQPLIRERLQRTILDERAIPNVHVIKSTPRSQSGYRQIALKAQPKLEERLFYNCK